MLDAYILCFASTLGSYIDSNSDVVRLHVSGIGPIDIWS